MAARAPMRIVLPRPTFDSMGLSEPEKLLRARAAFYLGMGMETVRLYVAGGTYNNVADETIELAQWLGMTEQDQVIFKE